jgi:hypothetical protein
MKDVSHYRITVDWMRLIGDREQDQREVKECMEKRKGKKSTGNMSEVIE